ncbi:hypothetical protein R1sor_004426 [Riccia sorocarpa]|uniref:[Histone H3]-lysine(27) N-trimethyltransferase n=1 Tax=Riccia sorocarpa TaxID=122646 RepID=A0ABD3HKF7_9MARC
MDPDPLYHATGSNIPPGDRAGGSGEPGLDKGINDGCKLDEQRRLNVDQVLTRLQTILRNYRTECVKEKVLKYRERFMRLINVTAKAHFKRRSPDDIPVKKIYRPDTSLQPAPYASTFSTETDVMKDASSSSRVFKIILPKVNANMMAPHYSTWVFTDRNQCMTHEEAKGQIKRAYYDREASQIVIFKLEPSEDEVPSVDVQKTYKKVEFRESEDFIIWTAIEEAGVDETLLKQISSTIERRPEDVEERYKVLRENGALVLRFSHLSARNDSAISGGFEPSAQTSGTSNRVQDSGPDCPMTDAAERTKQVPEGVEFSGVMEIELTAKLELLCLHDNKRTSRKMECEESEEEKGNSYMQDLDAESSRRVWDEFRKVCEQMQDLHGGDDDHHSMEDSDVGEGEKRAGKMKSSSSNSIGKLWERTVGPDTETWEDLPAAIDSFNYFFCRQCLSIPRPEPSLQQDITQACGAQCYLLLEANVQVEERRSESAASAVNAAHGMETAPDNGMWNKFEVDLFDKGLEIFGAGSCLIAKNLLKGLRTCAEVAARISARETQVQPVEKGKLPKKRGGRRLRFTEPSNRPKEAEGLQPQYSPCDCSPVCGNQCLCKQGGTNCEKYCGCLKECKNRFPGCQCVKSQCSSKSCVCVNANRECDPDVCRNCSVNRGDAVEGSTLRDHACKLQSNCMNMKILLRQGKTVLLAASDVSGWGLFLKDRASTNDYLGEYTGELISHLEATKRGKPYDKVNLNFLFDLNKEYVIDAYRLGNKFKFANHSAKPNCYVKILKVAGQHRVGIFAKRKIEPGEELFYDYNYEAHKYVPSWLTIPKNKKFGVESTEFGPEENLKSGERGFIRYVYV